jgi:hypothetical protein
MGTPESELDWGAEARTVAMEEPASFTLLLDGEVLPSLSPGPCILSLNCSY